MTSTDTNQASEDELLAQICKIFNVFPDELEYNLPGGIGTGKANELLALIRTEKLKLLAELDKSMPTAEQLTTKYGYHLPEKQYGYKLALHDIREVLTKLEAEL